MEKPCKIALCQERLASLMEMVKTQQKLLALLEREQRNKEVEMLKNRKWVWYTK